jgi:hypothetical protein
VGRLRTLQPNGLQTKLRVFTNGRQVFNGSIRVIKNLDTATIRSCLSWKRLSRVPAFAKAALTSKQLQHTVTVWLPPIVLVVAVLAVFSNTVQADPAPSTTELAAYLQDHDLIVGIAAIDGYNQIYYNYNGRQITVTSGNTNHIAYATDGPNIVWQAVDNGTGQIVLYNILSGTQTQLTTDGINQSPFVHSGIVTWQTWDGSNWQIKYYDGIQVSQITQGTTSSTGAVTDGKQIIYAQQIETNQWRALSYDISSGQTTTIAEGDTPSTAYPHFNDNGTVATNFIAR